MLTSTELKELIKESVKEAIREERLELQKALIPPVSDKEMEEIIRDHGLPEDYEKEPFEDLTEWVLHGNQI